MGRFAARLSKRRLFKSSHAGDCHPIASYWFQISGAASNQAMAGAEDTGYRRGLIPGGRRLFYASPGTVGSNYPHPV